MVQTLLDATDSGEQSGQPQPAMERSGTGEVGELSACRKPCPTPKQEKRVSAGHGRGTRCADQLMDELAGDAQGDLVGQFTADVSLPLPRRGLWRMVRGGQLVRQPAC